MIWRQTSQRLAAAVIALVSASAASADTYKLDPQHTEVRFTWDHLGLSRQGGRFTAVDGTLTFDQDKPDTSTLDVTIPIKSISTGVKKLDEHLITTKEFFDAAQFPNITFKSTAIRMTSDKTGAVDGDLTINGITKPVVLDVKWNFSGDHPLQAINPVYAGAYASAFSATTQIRRSDWGITRSIPFVSDELRITIETEALRTMEAPKDDAVETPKADGEAPKTDDAQTDEKAATEDSPLPSISGAPDKDR